MYFARRINACMGNVNMNLVRQYATKVKSSPLSNLNVVEKAKAVRLIRSPWLARGKGGLCTRPSMLYAQQKFRKCTGPARRRNPLAILQRLRRQYDSLSVSQKRPFETLAERHRKMRNADRKSLKGLRASPYALFMKKNYASTAAKFAHIQDPAKRLRSVSRAVAAKWKRTSLAQRKALSAHCSRQRSVASRKLIAMVRKMKTSQKK